MREKTIEKKLADAVKSRGGLAPKLRIVSVAEDDELPSHVKRRLIEK